MRSIASNPARWGLVLAGATASLAAQAGPLDERFSFAISGFHSRFDTTLRVDSSEFDRGTTFGFERDLGLSRNDSLVRYEAAWRIAERHRLSFAYFDATRSHRARIRETLVFQGQTYPVNLDVDGEFEAEVIELLYHYALIDTDRVRAEVAIGLHALTLSAGLRAVSQDLEGRAAATTSAGTPLPVIGGNLFWSLHPRWRLELQAQALQAKVNELDGRIYDLRAGINYRLSEHLDLGLNYNRFDMDLALKKARWAGSLNFSYHGPLLTLAAHF
jgi:hypothetical protein